MKIKRFIYFIHVYAVIFSFTFSAQFYASAGPAQETYSFHFENCSISQALREISNKSGIKIILKSDINKTILSKSYTNRKLDKIITDLLRGENCAVVWNYNGGNLASIGLYTFDKDNKIGSRRSFTEITPVPAQESGITNNSESLPIVHEMNSPSADESREVAASYMMAREMERNEGNDNNLPETRFQGRNRPFRRVIGSGDAPGSVDDSGSVNPGIDETTESGAGEEENAVTPEAPPGVPDEINTPPLPEAPDPHNFNGLEPPPMPPGL